MQQKWVVQSNQHPGCHGCGCKESNQVVPCYNAPEDLSIVDGKAPVGMPCSRCQSDCACTFDYAYVNFCGICGEDLSRSPQHQKGCPAKDTIPPCEECGLLGHSKENCRYQSALEMWNSQPKCALCDQEDHLPKECEKYEELLTAGTSHKLYQCAICLGGTHTTAECHQALAPPARVDDF